MTESLKIKKPSIRKASEKRNPPVRKASVQKRSFHWKDLKTGRMSPVSFTYTGKTIFGQLWHSFFHHSIGTGDPERAKSSTTAIPKRAQNAPVAKTEGYPRAVARKPVTGPVAA